MSIDAGVLTEEAVDMRSFCLEELFLNFFPYLFAETNGHATIYDNPLPKKEKK